MIKSFLIKVCPACNTSLKVKKGQKDDVMKLVCPNKNCEGSNLKKLQKGLQIFNIKGIGPKMVEKLVSAGVTSSLDLFNPQIIDYDKLINSGHFSEGSTLDNLLENIEKVKEIPVDKAILSLQIMVPKEDSKGTISIGKSLSLEIGKMISGVPYDFEKLSIQVREEISDTTSELYNSIINTLKDFENFGIKIKYFDKIQKVVEIKKVLKKVCFQDDPTSIGMTKAEFLKKLNWNEVKLKDADNLVVEKPVGSLVDEAKNANIKILTYKQIKLLFL